MQYRFKEATVMGSRWIRTLVVNSGTGMELWVTDWRDVVTRQCTSADFILNIQCGCNGNDKSWGTSRVFIWNIFKSEYYKTKFCCTSLRYMTLTGNASHLQNIFESEYKKTKFCCTSLRYMTLIGHTRRGRLRLTFEISSRVNMRRRSFVAHRSDIGCSGSLTFPIYKNDWETWDLGWTQGTIFAKVQEIHQLNRAKSWF
jgi:hypothetical protein